MACPKQHATDEPLDSDGCRFSLFVSKAEPALDDFDRLHRVIVQLPSSTLPRRPVDITRGIGKARQISDEAAAAVENVARLFQHSRQPAVVEL